MKFNLTFFITILIIFVIIFLFFKIFKSSKLETIYKKIDNLKINKNSTSSFVESKEKIFICPSDDQNLSNFVMLHELAHVITKNHGHTKEFENNLKQLILEAEKENIIDYSLIDDTQIKNYCKKCNC